MVAKHRHEASKIHPVLMMVFVLGVGAISGCGEGKSASSRTVEVTSEPAGAMVFIDNQYGGLTPYTAKALSPSIHSLKIQKSGYQTYQGVLDPSRTGGRIQIRLVSLAEGKIVVTSLPPDSRVFLDGRFMGNTPLTIPGLRQGEYQIRVVAEDYEPWIQAVRITDATPVNVSAKLSSRYEEYFKSAIAADPNELFNYTELAHHYLVRKDFDAAVEMYRKAMMLQSAGRADRDGEHRLLSEIAKAYVGWFADMDEEDLKVLRPKLLALFSNESEMTLSAFFRQTRAWDAQAKGRDFARPDKPNADTIKFLETAIQNDPKNIEMRLALGQLYTSDRQYDKALQVYQEVLKINPRHFSTHRQLSDLYRRQGRYDDAYRELELAAEYCDDADWKPELHEKLAGYLQAKQKYTEAAEQWKKAIAASLDPEDACRRRLRLALLYQKMGEKDEALRLYQEIVEKSKNPGLRNYAQYFLKRAQR